MHQIYTTEGIILKSAGYGEADKFFTILTRDFGLIRAQAQGVRKLQSKLRYSLSDFSLVNLSLVRGREKWRLANASLVRNFFSEMKGAVEARAILARVFLLVSRLVQGEEKNETFFEHIKSGAVYLAEAKPEGALLRNSEYLLVLRVLHSLGYLGSAPLWNAFTETPFFETDLLQKIDLAKRAVVETINQSLRETHL